MDEVGAQLGLWTPAGSGAVEADEDLHRQLFSRSLGTDLAAEIADQPRMVAMDEQTERIVITSGDQRHQALVVLVVGERGLFL
jgi:hypothetical protein